MTFTASKMSFSGDILNTNIPGNLTPVSFAPPSYTKEDNNYASPATGVTSYPEYKKSRTVYVWIIVVVAILALLTIIILMAVGFRQSNQIGDNDFIISEEDLNKYNN